MNRTIKQLIYFFCFWCGLDHIMYWVNRKVKRVLTFHNIMPDDLMAQNPLIGPIESLSNFVFIINEVGKRFTFDVNLNAQGTCTITFDDGYLNEYEIAGKWLIAHKIPAVMFVAGDIINAKPQDALSIDIKLLEAANVKMSDLPSDWVRLRFSGVTDENIKDMIGHGWIVGWHTWSHRGLGHLPESEQKKELSAPNEFISRPMSYPFGMFPEVTNTTLRIAREIGYPCAFSNDMWRSEMRGNYYRMRLSLSANKYELHFVLSGLKYFLQNGKRLPYGQ